MEPCATCGLASTGRLSSSKQMAGWRCGLAATQMPAEHEGPTVADAGRLIEHTGLELAGLIRSSSSTEASIGLAAINALLPPSPTSWGNVNAGELLADLGAGKRVAVVGHFPFVDDLRERVGVLSVLELHPRPGDLPASAAAEVVPEADVLAITATTLLNHTFDGLMALRRPDASGDAAGAKHTAHAAVVRLWGRFVIGSDRRGHGRGAGGGQPGRGLSANPSGGSSTGYIAAQSVGTGVMPDSSTCRGSRTGRTLNKFRSPVVAVLHPPASLSVRSKNSRTRCTNS